MQGLTTIFMGLQEWFFCTDKADYLYLAFLSCFLNI